MPATSGNTQCKTQHEQGETGNSRHEWVGEIGTGTAVIHRDKYREIDPGSELVCV